MPCNKSTGQRNSNATYQCFDYGCVYIPRKTKLHPIGIGNAYGWCMNACWGDLHECGATSRTGGFCRAYPFLPIIIIIGWCPPLFFAISHYGKATGAAGINVGAHHSDTANRISVSSRIGLIFHLAKMVAILV